MEGKGVIFRYVFQYLVADKIYDENGVNICEKITRYSQKCCTVNTMKNVFPVLAWLPKYNSKFLMSDFVAGLTVGLTAIPQAIAYATVAGLLPQYGLYSAFMGCFVYIIFGTCKDITVGTFCLVFCFNEKILYYVKF